MAGEAGKGSKRRQCQVPPEVYRQNHDLAFSAKTRKLLKQGLEEARRGEFSKNPPDLEADQSFADELED